MKKSLFILPLAFMMVLSGCGGGEGGDTSGTSSGGDPTTSASTSGTSTPSGSTSSTSTVTPEVVSVSLDVSAITLDVYAGDTHNFQATVETVGGASNAVTFESSNPSIVTVSSTGLATPVNAGGATITARSVFNPAKFASCSVTVTDNYPAKNHQATVSFGGAAPIALTPMRDAPEGEGGLYQFTSKVNVTKDQSIAFTFDSNPVQPGNGGDANNNTRGEYPNYVVHNDAEDANVYLKVYENDSVLSYSFWLDGYEEDPRTWYLKGNFNSWGESNPLDPVPYTDPLTAQYMIAYEFDVGDAFKFQPSDEPSTWLGYGAIENQDSTFAHADGEDNIVADVSGTYTIYVKEVGTDYSIWIGYPTVYITADYAGGTIYSGNAVDASQVSVMFHNGEDAPINVRDYSNTYYKLDDVTIPLSHTFDTAGDYEIKVLYVYATQNYWTSFNVHVENEAYYGLFFSPSRIERLTLKPGEHDYDEYKSSVITFEPNDTFCVYNNYDGAKWTPTIENESFDSYVIIEDGQYKVTATDPFLCAVYVKLSHDNDRIYFDIDHVVDHVGIKVGAAEDFTPMEEMEGPFEDTRIVQQYEYRLNAVKNAQITFDCNKAISLADGTYGNIKVVGGQASFVNTYEDCDVYVKYLGNLGFEVYATYDNNFYLTGSMTSWAKDSNYVMSELEDPSYKEQYQYTYIGMEVDDKFKIYSERPTYYGNNGYVAGYDQLQKDAGDYACFTEDGDENIVCNSAGNYKIIFKINKDDSLQIYVEKLPAVNSLVASYEKPYILKGDKLDLNKLSVAYYDEHCSKSDVKGEATFFIGEVEIDLDTYNFNTVKTETIKVRYDDADAETTFSVEIADTKVVYIFLGNIDNNLGDHYLDDGAEFFIWLWKDGGKGYLWAIQKSEMTSIDDGAKVKITLTVKSDIDRCKVYRCPPGVVSEGKSTPESVAWNWTDSDCWIVWDEVNSWYQAYYNTF